MLVVLFGKHLSGGHAMRPIKISLLIFALALCAGLASANPAIPISGSNLSNTIAVTNTFQSVQASNNGRIGCTIQNLGTHTMYVYFGAIASAATSASATLAAGQSVNCLIGDNYVLKDQVSITGTSGDGFFANFE